MPKRLRLRPRWVAGLVPALVLPALYAAASGASAGDVSAPVSAASHALPASHASNGDASAASVRYGRDVRPILSDRCFVCHGPDPARRKAGLRLDERESATREHDDGTPIVPGKPDESELLRRVSCDDPGDVMPPPDSNKKPLSAEERALLRRWIEQGAEYEPHWAFVPPRRPALPAGSKEPNAIDAFVGANLAARGFDFAPEAAPEVLLRRLFLDVTGLSPTPEEQAAYLADARPDRYERWVEKLLHEEPYVSRHAEHMATAWLDAARYADTSGIHMDAGRSIWLWRDWVLSAYRDNLPFDRFVTEQIAGDLLPGATDAQKTASGFNRNHVTTDEGGAIDEEYLVEYAVDRTATTGSVFLGLTLGCARCHEHKFDPISQDEFYRFYAYFNSNEEPGLYSQVPDAKRALEPFLEVPSEKDRATIGGLEARLAAEKTALDTVGPEETGERERFLAELARTSGLAWVDSRVVGAVSAEGAVLAVQPDGSVLASGKNPDTDEHVLRIRTDARGLSLLALEALPDASFPNGRVGRAYNGNAVLSGLEVEAVSVRDPARRRAVKFSWAWADHEQANGDFRVVNALDGDAATGWAVQGHEREGGRVALFLADEPFGFEGGTELVVKLGYRSMYEQHVLGRVRVRVGTLSDAGRDALPNAAGIWSVVGPFPAARGTSYAAAFGPEERGALDPARTFGESKLRWKKRHDYVDGELYNDLPGGESVTYLGRKLFVPSKRKVAATLGSDDGFRLFVDGAEVAKREVDRGLTADTDRVEFELERGTHEVVLEIVNTGGIGGFQWRPVPGERELAGPLMLALAPGGADDATDGRAGRFERAWRIAFSPGFRAKNEAVAATEKELAAARASVPRTMVMKERAMPRETYVLMRGQYDKPDKQRQVERGVPAALGALPEGAPADRRGLAMWLVDPRNPLVARVAVNRLWERLFGQGIVRTSEDFGLQGEWPSHPELLDWLAVEFVEQGWDVRRMLTTMLQSRTYRQSSVVRPELAAVDPGDRWLGYFPRQRLSAEGIRDGALFASGLLVEQVGGPSVKPYQPDGLWQEVAMLQSNTRVFERGNGEDLWRRSLYTYWKRACPPPSLLTFDAPTREFCTIRRASTNTPLQALVLWNDEQFVEAARVLAERTLGLAAGDDAERIANLMRRVTGRAPEKDEGARIAAALAAFRERFRAAPEDARALIDVGERPADAALDPAELAAWTLVASAVLNLDAAITKS